MEPVNAGAGACVPLPDTRREMLRAAASSPRRLIFELFESFHRQRLLRASGSLPGASCAEKASPEIGPRGKPRRARSPT